jgi:hypothetical protein
MLIYKYVTGGRIDILERGLIRFTQPSALNDPFETEPNLCEFETYWRLRGQTGIEELRQMGTRTPMQLAVAEFRLEQTLRDQLAKFRRDINSNHAFLSLSKKQNNLLMWSHYADSHRGFVLGFESDHAFFQTTIPREVTALAEVSYSPTGRIMPAPNQDWTNLAEIIFFTKSNHWSYEEELRLVKNPLCADDVSVENGQNIYLFKFPSESLKEVILGYRMPPALRQKIVRVVEAKYQDVRLLKTHISSAHFELDIQPCLR